MKSNNELKFGVIGLRNSQSHKIRIYRLITFEGNSAKEVYRTKKSRTLSARPNLEQTN